MGQILSVDTVKSELKEITEPIILVGGCFDILHPGHITFLENAKRIGGVLVVMLESDQKIKELKGINRPIFTQIDRAYTLSHLSMVDYVIPLPYFSSDQEYEELINRIEPNIFAITKSDPVIRYIQPHAEKLHASILEVTDRLEEFSSSNVIKRLNI